MLSLHVLAVCSPSISENMIRMVENVGMLVDAKIDFYHGKAKMHSE